MKTTLIVPILLMLSTDAYGDIIAQWNFNSPTPDGDIATGALAPSTGQGTAALIGGATSTFATGCTNDPAVSDNSGWNMASFPSQGTSNKTAGVQFNVSTLGYSDIVIRWDHRVSSTASKYCRLQYSPDGVTWLDYPTPNSAVAVVSSRQSYYEAQTNSLVGMLEAGNCAAFSFRIVAEWESTAVGGADNFVTTYGTNNYSRSGTIRLDMVTVMGAPIPGANTPPGISAFGAQTLRVGQSTSPLPFTIWDAEDAGENLTVITSSSNDSVVPTANLVIGGGGNNRTLTITAGTQPGSATVTLEVLDSGGLSSQASFLVTVLPLNTAPFISEVPGTNTLMNMGAPALPFTVGDMESPAESLTVSANCSNPALVPNDAAHIVFGGSGSNRTISLTPAAGQVGIAPMTVTVSDGANQSSAVFPVLVRPSTNVLFYDPFDYPNGSLLTNSAFLWGHRSGVVGQAQVTNGKLQVTTDQTEDVVAPLIGGPYARSNNTVLYASFKMTFVTLPKITPALFAHFSDGSVLRGRIYAGTSNTIEGNFRLFIANGSNTNTMIPYILSTNVTYTVITRYDLDAASTTVWLNPTAETDSGVTATDAQSAASIASYGFRQDADLGATLLVDDLRVGLSFASVLPSTTALRPIPLTYERRSGNIILSWTNASFFLQSAPGPKLTFTNVPGAASPFTNSMTGPQKFFRLKSQP